MDESEPIPLVRAGVFRPVLRLLARAGSPVDRLLEQVGIPPRAIQSRENLIPLHQGARFLEEAARGEHIDDLGLAAGLTTTFDALGVFGRVVLQARTLDDALATLFALGPAVCSGERWWLVREGARVRLCHTYLCRLDVDHRQANQYSVGLVINLVRLVAGSGWTPDEVEIETAAVDGRAGSPLLPHTRLRFDRPVSSLAFPTVFLSRPLGAGTPSRPLDGDLDEWLASAPARDFAGSLQQVMLALAPSHGRPRIGTTASALGISVRTLQRRLAESDLRFETLLRTTLLDVAAHLLSETSARVLDIALDLGYSDHAHFTRAFRSWTGLSPLAYRQAYRHVPLPTMRHEARSP